MIFCSNCGLLLPAGTGRCPRCGAPAPEPGPAADAGPAQQPHYQGAAEPPPHSLSMGGYLGYLLLFTIPVAGFIAALVFAFGHSGNRARRRLAQAFVLYTLILIGLLTVLYLLAGLAAYWALGPFTSGPWM